MKQIYNPFLPLYEYIPDGEPHVFGDRVYVYGSHDKENGEAFCMLDYVTYSAPVNDLKNWRYEGVIYKASNDPLFKEYPYMFAPDVVKGNDGRYYLYYSMAHHYPNCSYVMSVAVCDTPSGEFKFLGYLRDKNGEIYRDKVIFDPAVINDGGTVRLYFGMRWDFEERLPYEESLNEQMKMFKRTRSEIEGSDDGIMGAYTAVLEDDMLTLKSEPARILPRYFKGTDFEGHEFFEGSSMRKVGDKYYFIYSSFNNHELCYATSDYPDKDFKYGGVIISNGDIGLNGRKSADKLMRTGNNHGSIENINGEWYIFYHRHTTKTELSRQSCAEKIHILENGSIPQVEMTSCGLNGGPLVANGPYPAIICCNLTNGKMPQGHCENERLPHIISRDGERFICEVENGTVIGYKYFEFTKKTRIGIKYRSGDIAPLGKIKILTDFSGESVAEIEILPRETWSKSLCTVDISPCICPLYLKYEGAGSVDILEIFFE